MNAVASRQKINATIVVVYGLLITMASIALLRIVPVPKIITENAAPNAPALEIPRVNGDANGFLKIDCIATPATPSPIPAATPVKA